MSRVAIVLALVFASVSWGATPVSNFALPDLDGNEKALADLGDQKIVVLAFLGAECPLAKLYAPRLGRLAEEYSAKGVAFLGISPNAHDTADDLKKFIEAHQVGFPVLKDTNQELSDRLGVERVPTVIVLGPDRTVAYRGRVDDQYGLERREDGRRVSYQRPKARRNDLTEALDELIAGKAVSVASTESTGCLIGRARPAAPTGEITYTKHVAKVFNDRCVYCHRSGQIAPFTLTSYQDAVGWAEMIDEVVAERRMPPWHADPKHGDFKNDARLSDEEVDLIHRWVKSGTPEGSPSDLPEPPTFAEGWLIPEPDQVLYMRDKPYKVAAEGTVPYLMFTVDPGWKEDKWVKAMEPRPGNPKVVHHIVMFVLPPVGKKKYYSDGLPITLLDWFSSYAPGLRPVVLPDDQGRFVPAGSKLVFQMHYTPCGTPEEDLSYLGIKFADKSKVRREVAVQHAGNMRFVIPAHAKNHELESWYTFERDSLLLTVSPHMHWRGKDFKYTLIDPDGKEEVILWVPQYDFGWQTTYALKEPRKVKKGSKLHCVAHYDNSADNMNNPDPNEDVRFGEQTWEEMMYGWFEIALDDRELDLTKDKPKAETKNGQ